jgi:hypothetical protein
MGVEFGFFAGVALGAIPYAGAGMGVESTGAGVGMAVAAMP